MKMIPAMAITEANPTTWFYIQLQLQRFM
jgi:hypothetical protein